MDVSHRKLWVLAVALWMGCQRANDIVLQPDATAGMGKQAAANTATAGRADTPSGGSTASSASAGAGSGAAAVGGTPSAASAQPTSAGGAGASGGAANTPSSGGAGASAAAGTTGGSAAGAGTGGQSAEAGASGQSAGSSGSAVGAADPACDFNGVWIAKQMTVSEALSLPQTSNNWYYLELRQSGSAIEVVKHFDCGIEVRGTVTVTTSRATVMGSLQHNVQVGRKITSMKQGDKCSFEAARFWSIRGADEQRFVPNEARDSMDSISQLATSKPLPTPSKSDGAIDIDGDGKLGIAFQVTGVIMGVRNSVQRDWSRWFTEPGYEIAASMDWTKDLKIRADFDNEESILDPTSGLLVSGSAPKAGAKHALVLRFLGRDDKDPRVTALVKADQVDTCFAIQDALPAGTIE